ncbi:MAG: PIN domain-containing protein [Rhodothermales bacterium]
MIIADTGAVIALIDADDRQHGILLGVFEDDSAAWVLPWAVLPEVDYLLVEHLGPDVAMEFVRDLAEGRWFVDWGDPEDLQRALALCEQYASLKLGLVDAVVIATAERLRASDIATLDLRDFGAVAIEGQPRLLPRDL